MSWNPFRRRDDEEPAQEPAAHDAAAAAPSMPADDDPTDPLINVASYREESETIQRWDGMRLDRVSIGAGDGAGGFLKLVLEQGGAVADALPGILLEGGALFGLRDLLADDRSVLSAAIEPVDVSFREFSAGIESGQLRVRVLDILVAMHDLATGFARCEAGGLGWRLNADALGFCRRLDTAPAGWQLRFSGFGELQPGEPADASEIVTLLRPLVDSLLSEPKLLPAGSIATGLDRLLDGLQNNDGLSLSKLATEIQRSLHQLQLAGHATTDNGMRRQHNEDAWLMLEMRQHSAIGSSLCIAAVADGMGGHESGEIASSLALSMLRQQLQTALTAPSTRPQDTGVLAMQLATIIPGINRALIERSAIDQALTGMGTTLCGFAMLGSGSTLSSDTAAGSAVFNVGDSRCYLVTARSLIRITRDHSFVQELVDNGSVDPDEAFDHPRKNVITRCLGGDGLEIQADIYSFRPGPCERLLVCSDGLSDALRDSEISAVLAANAQAGLAVTAQALVDAANAAGGPDNITVLLLDCRL
ncbi:MAG: serine/threonine-protein phosphatase [Planctomycetales bacterium]|nr:serine/threonine-protein phosphatase [bacterium]UNM09599.1 MAG: serine/threonine-protein phosphatase [Planctomycetales bacterium]